MIRRLAGLACLCALALGGGCGQVAPTATPPVLLDPAAFDADLALRETVDFVALGPRDPGTQGAADAAVYLQRRLEEIGLPTDIDAFEDPTPQGPKTFRNVIARSPGSTDDIVILLSHYDTKAGISDSFAGANDSGSSTGLLLAMARQLRTSPRTGPAIWLAFVDGEECLVRYSDIDGLHGSRHLAEALDTDGMRDRVRAVIVVDMIGDRDLNVSIPRNCSPELSSLAFRVSQEQGVRKRFSLFRSAIIDDHVPFHARGFNAIDLIDFHFGASPGKNDYWHTDEDSIDKISAESLGIIGRVVIGMVNELSR